MEENLNFYVYICQEAGQKLCEDCEVRVLLLSKRIEACARGRILEAYLLFQCTSSTGRRPCPLLEFRPGIPCFESSRGTFYAADLN